MQKLKTFVLRHWVVLTLVAVIMAAVAVVAWRCLPSSAYGMRSSAVLVETRSWYELRSDNRPVMYFSGVEGDSIATGLACDSTPAVCVTSTAGCWMNRWPGFPSCRGRIVTALGNQPTMPNADARTLLQRTVQHLKTTIKSAKTEDEEINYYLRSHGVQDEGYQLIAATSVDGKALLAKMKATADTADSLLALKTKLKIVRRVRYEAFYRDGDSAKVRSVECLMMAQSRDRKLALLQTTDGKTPADVKTQYLLPWDTTNHTLFAVGFGGLGVGLSSASDATPTIVKGRRTGNQHNFPRVLVSDGCPLFTPRGLFAGIATGNDVEGRSAVSKLLMKGGWR